MYTTRKEAKLNGATQYFTGNPCPKNHIAFRNTTSGGCIECAYEYKKARYYTTTKLHQNAKSKEWRRLNSHKVHEYNMRFKLNNPGYYSKWKQENKDLVNASTYKRRTAKLNRMPKWVNKDHLWLIKEVYELAALRTKQFGYPWHVDHIIPLQGDLVSGLHVVENLQVIPGIENIKKANRYIIE